MSKKKLAFYDAFRQKPDDATEHTSDTVSQDASTSSKNISGYVAYTPGEELTLRPRPKHIPTSHHSVGGQNIEVRAKGSSLAPGMAQKYQTPNVNRSYLPTDSGTSGASRPMTNVNLPNVPPRNTPPMPPAEPPTSSVQLQAFDSVKSVTPKPQPSVIKSPEYHAVPEPNVKAISSQSETMPYLDVEDLETQNIQIPSPKKIPSVKPNVVNQELSTPDGVLTVPIPVAFIILFVGVILIIIAFFVGSSLHSENNQAQKMSIPDKNLLEEPTNDLANALDHRKIDQPIHNVEVPEVKPTIAPIDIPKKGIIIRACTVESLDKAKSLAKRLESWGIKPTELKQTKRGVLISVGPFETSAEANNMLKSLKFKSINGWKPFEDAYIINK